jgi:hypothetical protein
VKAVGTDFKALYWNLSEVDDRATGNLPLKI